MKLKNKKKRVSNKKKRVSNKKKLKCINCMKMYYKTKKEKFLKNAHALNPRNADVLVQLGGLELSKNNMTSACKFFEKIFNEKLVDKCISIDTIQGRFIAFIIGRHSFQIHKYKTAYKFLKLAANSAVATDDSHKIQLATLISGCPESITDAKEKIKEYNLRMDELLNKNNINISFIKSDIYNTCVLSAFNLEIYYEADLRLCMNKHYKLTKKILPNLHYIRPHLYNKKPNRGKPYKLGIASGWLTLNNSVIADFGGVINQLSKEISNNQKLFDITYIYIVQNKYNEYDFAYKNHKHIVIESTKDPNWLQTARDKIGNLDLDLLLYLDSTMASTVQRVAMSKLARVQAVSHGHPVTSGIDSEIMDYYVSWGAAELDYEISKNHYTEKLILLPKQHMHQYYNYRTTNGVSNINNMRFDNLTRKDLAKFILKGSFDNELVEQSTNWYTCMQKPFKRHPEFDYILCEIIRRDPNGRLFLHDSENDENLLIMKNRLKKYNIDMTRVHFIPCQPHHILMALYKLSNVILDSYYAGGCTTTREALEIGIPVVTLPSKYLGGRWSLAYYQIIGVLDLVAKNKENYIDIAIKIGTDVKAREHIIKLINNNVHKLFHRKEAVESWKNVLIEMINSVNPVIANEARNKIVDKTKNDDILTFPKTELITELNIHEYLTIGIKTFNRPLCLKNNLEQIRSIYKNIKIIVADDSDDISKQENKKYIEDNNAILIDLPFDVGLSYGRNSIVNRTTTKYYLTLDDDNYIDKQTKLLDVLNFMKNNDDIGLIGGVCYDRKQMNKIASTYSFTFMYVDGKDIYCRRNFTKINDKLNIYETNIVLNLFIAKTSVLKDNPWDNKLKFEEHKTFFVNLYQNNIKCAISHNLIFREIIDNRRIYMNISSPYKRINHDEDYNLRILKDKYSNVKKVLKIGENKKIKKYIHQI